MCEENSGKWVVRRTAGNGKREMGNDVKDLVLDPTLDPRPSTLHRVSRFLFSISRFPFPIALLRGPGSGGNDTLTFDNKRQYCRTSRYHYRSKLNGHPG